MDAPDPIIVTPVFHALVDGLRDRIGPHVVVADARWQRLAEALQTGAAGNRNSSNVDVAARDLPLEPASLVVGPSAFVLRHAATAEREFGFVMPVARSARWWQRVTAWRDEATIALWRAGWSPVAIDRLVVADDVGSFEFAIGNARPTPAVATPSVAAGSALDDGD